MDMGPSAMPYAVIKPPGICRLHHCMHSIPHRKKRTPGCYFIVRVQPTRAAVCCDKSCDTDVLILALAFCHEVGAHLYIHTGKGVNTHTVDVQDIHNHLGDEICDALIGLHCFSGCDTVSSLYRIGKMKAVKTLLSNPEHCSALRELGKTFSLSPELYAPIEAFTCELYKSKTMFGPPCSIQEHVQREVLPQTKTVYGCTSTVPTTKLPHTCVEPDIPSPVAHGWRIKGDNIAVNWMTLPPAPDCVLELVHCSCKKRPCAKAKCTCRQHQLLCVFVR